MNMRAAARHAAWGMAGLLLALLLAFTLLPVVIYQQLRQSLEPLLARPVTIGRVAVDPFGLRLTIEDLRIIARADEGDGAVAGFARLDVDLTWGSLAAGAALVEALHIEAPFLHIVRSDARTHNWAALLARKSAGAATAPPRFAVHNIVVHGGRIELDDRFLGARHRIDAIELGLPFLSTLPATLDTRIAPRLAFSLDGAAFQFSGRTTLRDPVHGATLNLELTDFAPQRYLAYLPPDLLQAVSGQIDARLELSFTRTQDGQAAFTAAGTVDWHELTLIAAAPQQTLRGKRLALELARLEWPARVLHLRQVAADSLAVELEQAPATGMAAATPAEETAGHWQLQVDALQVGLDTLRLRTAAMPATLHGSAVRLTARDFAVRLGAVPEVTLAHGELNAEALHLGEAPAAWPAPFALSALTLAVTDFALPAAQPWHLEFDSRINDAGKIAVSGPVALEPLTAQLDLTLSDLDLTPFQALAGAALPVRLTRGGLRAHGWVDIDAPSDSADSAPRLGFAGDIGIDRLQAVLAGSGAEFINWERLDLAGVELGSTPAAVRITTATLATFSAGLQLDEAGHLNLRQIGGAGTASQSVPAVPAASSTAAASPTIEIGSVRLSDGMLDFDDHYIRPNYHVRLGSLQGSIADISSLPGQFATVDLAARLDRTAPVSVSGRFQPFHRDAPLDIAASVSDFELTGLSAYSGKYVGYGIDKGKFSATLNYQVRDHQLSATNRLFLDQLTFGDKVDSPQATTLPVTLLVALLQNPRGEIDIELPIGGSLDDPEFSVGGILVQVIGNLAAKIVSAPFRFLASLVGGDGDLSHIDFAAGQALLTAEATPALTQLAQALAARPGLRLDVSGRADPARDGEALRRAGLQQRLATLRATEKGAASDAVTEARLLRRLYANERGRKGSALPALASDAPLASIEAALLAAQAVTDDELRTLAQARAQAAKTWLVEQGKVPGARIFLRAPGLGGRDEAGRSRADFALR